MSDEEFLKEELKEGIKTSIKDLKKRNCNELLKQIDNAKILSWDNDIVVLKI